MHRPQHLVTGSQHRQQWLTVGIILLLLTAGRVPTVAADEERFRLSDDLPLTATRVRYSIRIDGQVMTPSAGGMQKFDLTSSGRFDFQQRRIASEQPGAAGVQGRRRFTVAGTETSVDGHRTAVSLPATRRQIQICGEDNQLVSFCEQSALTRNELDLIQMPFDPLAVRFVLPVAQVAVDEKWNTDAWVMPVLTGIETAIDQTASCSLKTCTDKEAVVTFRGNMKGAVRGSAASVTYSGEFTIDRISGLITAFKGQQKEKRTAGPVSPGLDITANVSWQQSADPSFSPTGLKAITTTAAQKRLQFRTPGGLGFQHSREWHLFHQTGSVTMLRQLRQGELISQCNISTHVTVPPKQHTPDREFSRDVATAVQERKGEVIDEKTIRDDGTWRIRRIRTRGRTEDDTIQWDHYLCSAVSGEQFTILFSHSQSDDAEFGNEADTLLSTLKLAEKR